MRRAPLSALLGGVLIGASLTGCAVATTVLVQNAPAAGSPALPGGSTAVPVGVTGAVTRPVKDVVVTPGSLVLPQGTARDITATVSFLDGGRNSDVLWASSDDTIAVVNATNGRVSAVKAGTTTIMARANADPGKNARVTVTVKAPEAIEARITIEPETADLDVEGSTTFSATVLKSNGATAADVVWTSSDPAIATVSGAGATGTVIARKPGSITLTAAAAGDQSIQATAKITVKPKGR